MDWTSYHIGIVLLIVATSGCSLPAETSSANPTTDENPMSSGTDHPACSLQMSGERPTVGVTASTIPPAELAAGDAVERALCAEKRFLRQQLRNATCLNRWNVFEAGAGLEVDVTVVNRTTSGVLVTVVHPYQWNDGRVTADTFSRATYLVTVEGSHRVSGDDVAPCK